MNPSQLMQTRLNQLANSGLNFDAPKEEMDLIIKIVARIMQKWGPSVEPKLLAMELTACHLNGTRLNLQALSDTDDQRLQADVFGIRRHIDRDTGKLKDGFIPVFMTQDDGPGEEDGPWASGYAKRLGLADGEPCDHPGCLSHISHPCKGCGRIGGVSK